MNLKSTLNKIYTYRALDDFILMYPFYAIYMASKGLSVFQISTLFILWSVTDMIFNVPTGVLADKYSRKNILGIGQLLKAVGFALWFIYPHYLGFALGFVMWGIGGALAGGAYEALVYDELRAVGQEADYVKVTGRANSFALGGDLAATVVAGVAILLGYGFLFGASIAVIVASSLMVFTLPETPRFEEVADTRYFAMLRQGVKEATRNRHVLGIILLGGFIGAVYGSFEEYVPLFAGDTRIGLSLVPLAVGLTVAAAAVGSFVAYRYEKLSTARFMALLILAGLFLMGAGKFGGVPGILLLVGYTLFIRLLQSVFDGKLQHSISGGLRATIGSVSGVALELMSVIIYLVYGLITTHGSNFDAFKVFGGVTIVVALMYLVVAPRMLSRQGIRDLTNR